VVKGCARGKLREEGSERERERVGAQKSDTTINKKRKSGRAEERKSGRAEEWKSGRAEERKSGRTQKSKMHVHQKPMGTAVDRSVYEFKQVKQVVA
jgi:hypothetical protein